MRLLRFSLLINFFSKTKNLTKALKLINVGIFLSIFAGSTALISFYIEKQINELEYELVTYRQSRLDSTHMISTFHSDIKKITHQYNLLNDRLTNLYLLSTTKFGEKSINMYDYLAPSIYISKFEWELANTETLKIDEMTLIDLIKLFKDDEILNYYNLEEGEKKEILNKLDSLTKSVEKFETINIKDYEKIIFYNSEDNLIKEIKNSEELLLLNRNKISDDFSLDYIFFSNLVEVLELIMDLLRNSEWSDGEYIKEKENKIINLSKNEKNIILLTFIFQFIIFTIIQIFEISSVNQNQSNIFTKILKKNEKKN